MLDATFNFSGLRSLLANKKKSITSELCRKLSRARDPPERLASERAGIFQILMREM